METSQEFNHITDEQLSLFLEKRLPQEKQNEVLDAISASADCWLVGKMADAQKNGGKEPTEEIFPSKMNGAPKGE